MRITLRRSSGNDHERGREPGRQATPRPRRSAANCCLQGVSRGKTSSATYESARGYRGAVPKVIAYGVLAHHDPEMVRRLAAELVGRPVVVHVDAKTDIGLFEQIPGIRLVQDRVTVHWGGFSVVEATLRLYRDCLDELGNEPNAAVALLSGSDFPVRPIAEFEEYVAAAKWSEHIRAVPLITGYRASENRIRRRWYFDLVPTGMGGWRQRRNAIIRRALAWTLPRRPLASYKPLTPAVSSQWTLLSRACLERHPSHRIGPGAPAAFSPDVRSRRALLRHTRSFE